MSITFFINGGQEWAEKNNKVKIKRFEDDNYEMKIYPFELNVANGNAGLIFKMLGMGMDWCGEADAADILRRVRAAVPQTREQTTVRGGGITIINCGVSDSQSLRYLNELEAIAEEAVRRKEKIVWG